MGGFLNAHTSREHTIYTTKIFRKDVPKSVEILSDIIQHSKYKKSDIQYERGVILTEGEEVYRIPEEYALDLLHEVVYEGSPFSYTILGPTENISRFTREDIVEYVNSYYTCNRIGIVGVGGVDHDDLVQLTEKWFTSIKKSSPKDIDTYPQATFKNGYRNVKSDVTFDTFCTIGYEGASWVSDDLIPMLIAQGFTGSHDRYKGFGYDSLPSLAERLVATNLCESCASYVTSYTTSGIVGFNIVTKERNVTTLIEHIMAEISRFVETITEEDVQRSKEKIKTCFCLSNEELFTSCDDLARQLMTANKVVSLEQQLERVDAVNLKTVKDIFDRYFIGKKPAIVTLGDAEELDYDSLKPRLYSG